MDRLRCAILDILNEDIGMVGEATAPTEELVDAWNALVHTMPDFDKIEVTW